MDFSGKNTERVLMRVPEDMKREVEAMAQLERRPINHQYRFLIAFALEQLRRGAVHGTRRPDRQLSSTAPTSPELSRTSVNSQLPLPGTVGPIPARKRRIA